MKAMRVLHAALLVTTVLGQRGSPPEPPAECGEQLMRGDYCTIKFPELAQVNGKDRFAVVNIPDVDKQLPVVFGFHGSGGNWKSGFKFKWLSELGELIAVAGDAGDGQWAYAYPEDGRTRTNFELYIKAIRNKMDESGLG